MKVVFFSIEPTVFGPTYEQQIVNIAAIHDIFEELAFNVYVRPTCRLMPSRTEQCGLKMEDGIMYLDSEKVEAKEATIAMQEFIDYLKAIDDKNLLVSYGDFYDARRIVKMAAETGFLGELREVVAGFADMKVIYERNGYNGKSDLTYFADDQFEHGCTVDETNTASKRVVIFQKLFRRESRSPLLFKNLSESAKTVDEVLEETLEIEERINKDPNFMVPPGYYLRF